MPRLFGDRIMLREYQKDDLPYMRMWVNNPDVVVNLSDIFLYPHSVKETEQFLQSMLEGSSEMKGFVIADKATEEYIGQIDLVKTDWKNRLVTMGIVIGNPGLQGKGYGAEAIMLLQDFVFNRMNMNKLELNVHDFNQKAYRCYVKCGFVEEGRIRQRYFVNGRYTDTIVMGILKAEYEKRQQQSLGR